ISCTHQQCLIVPPTSPVNAALSPFSPTAHSLIRALCTSNQNSSKPPDNKGANMSNSKIRQNYHEESEAGVNKQINLELYASYVYQQLVLSLHLYHNGTWSNKLCSCFF